MQSALEKYEHFTPSEFPNFSQYESWLGADLMIKGLELAGKNPTQAGVIHALRNLKSYNGNGLLPETINYSTDFGHDLPQVVRLVHDRREERLRRLLEQPRLRQGHPGHDDGAGLVDLWFDPARRPLGVPGRIALTYSSTMEMAFFGQVRTAISTFSRSSSGGCSSST